MSCVWLFGGQGCERPGMGLHLPPHVLDPLLHEVSEAVGRDARRILERGGPGWGRTEVLQPLLVAVGLATAAVLPAPSASAGHSLGALTAWSAAGGCTPAEAIRLAAVRGRAMAGLPGGMVALPPEAPAPPGLSLAVVNPGQNVWAGSERAVLDAVAAGARRVPVAGPWHTAAMAPAAEALHEALAALPPRDTPAWIGPDDLPPRESLVAGLTSPFRWDRVLDRLQGIRDVVLCGPARPLGAHLAARLPHARVWPTETAAELSAVRTHLESAHAT